MITENPENALVPAGNDNRTAILNAVALWTNATTSDGIRRNDLVRDKQQVVTTFFNFTKKHPADVTPLDVREWLAGAYRSRGSRGA
jgi:hypothetical protein